MATPAPQRLELGPEPAAPGQSPGRRRRRGGDRADLGSLGHPLLSAPAVVLVLVCFLAPLVVLFLYSLWPTVEGQIVHHWTFENYSRALSTKTYLPTLLRTFWFVGLSSLITVVLTFPFAYYVALRVRPGRRIFLILLAMLPFFTSYLIRVFAWLNMFGEKGILNEALNRIGLIDAPLEIFGFDRPAIVITFVYLLFPLSFLATYITLERMNPTLLEAASDLGANSLRRTVRVVLPIARTGLLAGFIVSFIAMAGDYVTPSLIGGTEGIFYSNLIVNQFGASLQWGFGAALGIVLLVSVALLLIVLRRLIGTVESAGEYTRSYQRVRSPFLTAYAILFNIFLYTPVALLVFFSFNEEPAVGFPFHGPTLAWFETAINDTVAIEALETSLTVAVVSVALSLLLGTTAALYMARHKGFWRNFSFASISAPMLLPPVILGIAIIIGLNALNVERGLWTIVVGHVVITLPLVTLLILSRLEGLDVNQELAAMDLGARPWRALVRIALPQALPGIIGAAMIAFAISMDEFILTFLVTGSQTTLPLYIYSQLRFKLTPELTAISTLMLVASFALVLVGAMIALGRRQRQQLTRS